MRSPDLVRLILRLAAIATFILGAITLLAPGFVVELAEGFSSENTHIVRFIGTALIGFGVTNWVYSKSSDIREALPAIYGNLASLILAIIVDIIGLALNMLSPSAWLVLGLHAIFAVAFLKCIFLIRLSKSK